MVMSIIKAISIAFTASVVGIFVAFMGILAIFFFAIFGALMGAITGFILQNTPLLGSMVTDGFTLFGIANPNLVNIGAALGFVAGFFKPAFSQGEKKDCC